MCKELLFKGTHWDLELIDKIWNRIEELNKEKYQLDYFPPQIEVVTANQMIHYSSMHGLPFMYDHWSFGKGYVENHKAYNAGQTGLAYEMIINTNPSVCYIMENNDATMQALVLAHAAIGHSSFFKNNYGFKTWTSPDTVLTYAKFAKEYVAECEKLYGPEAVEKILDAAHALQFNGIDRYVRTRELRDTKLDEMKEERARYQAMMDDPVWRTIPAKAKARKDETSLFPWPFPEENLLYFIEKNSPGLDKWQRELIRIVRYFAQYFYPQIQTKLMNEGWASFWHYTLMTDLHEEGSISDASMLSFLQSHTSVCNQPQPKTRTMDGKVIDVLTSSINPYALGYKMFKRLRQACENPTEADYKELPTICNTNWVETLKGIAEDYNDSTFVGQFLTSDLVEEFGFLILKPAAQDRIEAKFGIKKVQVTEVQDKDKLSAIRKQLAEQYAFGSKFPTIEVIDYEVKGDRSLTLLHRPYNMQVLEEDTALACMKSLTTLWGYPVRLRTIDEEGDEFTRSRRHF